eukprot:6211735-Pleurochrysis_carterae.AAC.6
MREERRGGSQESGKPHGKESETSRTPVCPGQEITESALLRTIGTPNTTWGLGRRELLGMGSSVRHVNAGVNA